MFKHRKAFLLTLLFAFASVQSAPTQITFTLPNGTVTTGVNPISVVNAHTAGAGGFFQITNPTNPAAALYGLNRGNGRAGYFVINNASNSKAAVEATTNGTGAAGYFWIGNPNNTFPAVYSIHQGNGRAGYFINNNVANTKPAVHARTLGSGPALLAVAGSGLAGEFQGSVQVAGNVSITGSLSASVGGDLSGTLPNPTIAAGAVTTAKIADGAVTTAKLAAGAVTDAKVTDVSWSKITGAPSSFPPSGPAGGDLSGTYPNPTVAKIQGRAVSNAVPSATQVLKWSGTQWEPAADSLELPFAGSTSLAGDAFAIQMTGTDRAGYFEINNASSSAPALETVTNGSGAAFKATAPANGTAFEINNGAFKVTGAGVGTSTTIFIHRATAANISGAATQIDHLLLNGDPNAIVIVTQNLNPPGFTGTSNPHPIAVQYNSVAGRWEIVNQDGVAMPVDAAFNVMIVKP